MRMVPSGSGMMEKIALVAADAKNEADSKQKNCHDVGGASSAAASGATTSTAAMASLARRAVIALDLAGHSQHVAVAVTKPCFSVSCTDPHPFLPTTCAGYGCTTIANITVKHHCTDTGAASPALACAV